MINDPATIFVVDDDPSLLRSLARLLRSVGYRVEVFASPLAFLDREAFAGAGCVLLDLNMPDMSGLALQRILRDRACTLPIIFMTGSGDVSSTVRAFKGGAVDFITKPFNDRDLVTAVLAAVTQHQQLLADQARVHQLTARFARLSGREREVVTLVSRGCLNKQIAAELGLVEKTVKVHRAHAMDKLEVESVPELVDLLRALGIR
jgi:FixJ family two-component response regulator